MINREKRRDAREVARTRALNGTSVQWRKSILDSRTLSRLLGVRDAEPHYPSSYLGFNPVTQLFIGVSDQDQDNESFLPSAHKTKIP